MINLRFICWQWDRRDNQTTEFYVTPMLFEEKDLPAKIAEKQIYGCGEIFCDMSQGLK